MDTESNKIVDFQLVQVNQATSSVAMEKKGFEQCLDIIIRDGVEVSVVATDRHTGIKKLMREKYVAKGIDHQFDPYHMANWVRKKVTEKTKLKKFSDLGPWVRSIINHLWWSAATCGGDPEVLAEKWQSILYHIANQHTWEPGTHLSGCQHGELSPDDIRKKKWLRPGSGSYKALEDIVQHKSLQKDLGQLCKFIHTGKLEVFHSLLNKYCPKRQEFDFLGMIARSQLAILDHNHNVGRQHAIIVRPSATSAQKGENKFSTYWSKATKQWVARPVLEEKCHAYRQQLLIDVVRAKEENQTLVPNFMMVPEPVTHSLAKSHVRPSKEELVEKHKSRFIKL